MIQIKKSRLVFVIIFALVCGAAGVCAVSGMDISDVFYGGGVRVSGPEYDDFLAYTKNYEKAEMLREYIEDNYYIPVDDEKLKTGMYKGMLKSLEDPYSDYLTAEEYAEEMISIEGEYSGVGVTMTGDAGSGKILVISPTKGAPADRAGIRSGDYILKVDGVDYTAEDLTEASVLIRGEAGSKVTLTIQREENVFDVVLTRESIHLQSVYSEDLGGGMGYIQISQFINDTGEDFQKALDALEASGASSFVLDLRNNGGGLVDEAVEVADSLMDKGTVVYTEDAKGEKSYYKTKNGKTDLDFVVLVNCGTASASEILAAGLQDNGVCKIVGEKSFGKGIIQQVERLRDGSALKLTVMQYFSPSGKTIHKEGISPDVVVEFTDDCYDENGFLVNDLQLKKAEELLKHKK